MAKQARKDGALEVRARIEADEGGGLPSGEVVAYVFSGGGKLLDAQPLKDGVAKLRVPLGDEPAPGRVLIGPRVPDDVPALDELLRRGAIERHIRLEPKLPPLDVVVFPPDWLCWFLSRCTVNGTLLKRVDRDGVTVDLPVCDADVEIYEVDPLPILIPRLPDDILDRLRDVIVRQPIPIPFPEPDPGPLFPPVGPAPGPGPDPSPIMRAAHAGHVEPARAAQPAPQGLLEAISLAGSRDELRRLLLAHPLVVRPLICRFFPQLVTKNLLGTAHTDECGHFRLTFFRGCRNPDQPDLWFKATQQWFFGRMTIYAPTPIACHTWWNYSCGSEVTLYTTNPLALTCPPCGPVIAPDDFVMVWGIGRQSAHAIHGASADLPNTPAQRGLTSDGRPFGGLLRLRLDFDSSLRGTLGIRYYRVSWRAAGGTFQPLLDECHRHYKVGTPTGPTFVGYPLGPNVVGGAAGLFEIPPALPPAGEWTVADPVEDTSNAKFPSHLLVPRVPAASPTDNAGLHELKIELFDAAGAAVDAAALGVAWVVPDVDDLSTPGTFHGEAPAAGAVQAGAFVLPLHVDNNRCEASVGTPTLNGSAASDNCGVMRYAAAGGTVAMPYHAAHRNGFATRSFAVARGAGAPLVPPSVSGLPVTGGDFAPTATVAALRETCQIAAFSESLYVAASATDGWSRQSGLDASDVRAFTLAPQP
jgi:hypothetical protein